ncbi:MAG: pilus assembly protein TadG-related protein [Lachnospiraceae bacterium]
MFKRFFRTEKGSVTVFVAVTMTVLLGFAALAVDYGSLTNERSLLQNAADAAALAGVVKVKTKPVEAEADAKAYVLKNTTGVSEGDIQVTPTSDTLQVTITKECPAFFSQVLTGRTTNQVAASATAKHEGEIQAPGYAIWAEHDIELKNKSFIDGSIHSNSGDFKFNGGVNNIDEESEVDESEKSKKGVTIKGKITSGGQTMPDYTYLIQGATKLNPDDYKGKSGILFTEEKIAALDENIIYYMNSSEKVVIDGPLNINLIADGLIVFNGSKASVDAKILYSTGGSIELNGHGAELKVLAYAPNGSVTWNGSGTKLSGAIIADKFIEDGSEGSVSYDSNVLNKFPRLVPHLIK